jgi:(p)ppGpp synthase/HD superfamily hydrolase
MTKYEQVVAFAFDKHAGHVDDDGEPYINHVCQVVDILRQITDNQDVICAAYLHDTIEDCGVTYKEIEKLFGKNIADLVLEVTHDGTIDKSSKCQGHYFPRLQSKEAIMIKFADRLSNISRMTNWDLGRQKHYLQRSKFWKSSLDDKIIEGQPKMEWIEDE